MNTDTEIAQLQIKYATLSAFLCFGVVMKNVYQQTYYWTLLAIDKEETHDLWLILSVHLVVFLFT